jgi:hypothetical protein
MPEDDRGWRWFKSETNRDVVDWVLVWIVVLVLLGVIAYCAVTAKPAYATGGMLLLLGGLVRGRRAS